MSKFSIKVFIGYISVLLILWFTSRYAYFGVIGMVTVLQIINMIFRKRIDNVTKYKDSFIYESEKFKFFFTYFGFPITILFPEYFKELRKYSYYERKMKQLKELIEMYEEHKMPINEKIKNDWIICNRYLKLKKYKIIK